MGTKKKKKRVRSYENEYVVRSPVTRSYSARVVPDGHRVFSRARTMPPFARGYSFVRPGGENAWRRRTRVERETLRREHDETTLAPTRFYGGEETGGVSRRHVCRRPPRRRRRGFRFFLRLAFVGGKKFEKKKRRAF